MTWLEWITQILLNIISKSQGVEWGGDGGASLVVFSLKFPKDKMVNVWI